MWKLGITLVTSNYKIAITHWGRVTHICVGNLNIIDPDNGLSPGRRQAIIWTHAGILLIVPWGTNFSEILPGIQTFSFKKMHLKMSSVKWRPFYPGLNVIISWAGFNGHKHKSLWFNGDSISNISNPSFYDGAWYKPSKFSDNLREQGEASRRRTTSQLYVKFLSSSVAYTVSVDFPPFSSM